MADIGCGLGDILLSLRFEDRLGLDDDPAVLRGAEIIRKTLFRGKARFAVFSFPEVRLDGGFDAMILVNWPHAFPPDPLTKGGSRIFRDNLNPGGSLIIDTVSKDGYPYRHAADTLLGDLGGVMEQIGAYPCGRRVWKVTKAGDSCPEEVSSFPL